MKNTPKYSVIIPVYNAADTLTRCIHSLTEQNYSDMELILVNDGSTDSSGDLCAALAENNRQIRYISKPNGGVSTARNAGLELASGKYVTFVDSDDTVPDDYFRILDAADEVSDADFVWFSYKSVAGQFDHVHRMNPAFTHGELECAEVFSRALCDKTMNPPWNKRYINSLIRDNRIRFPESLSIGEDTVFNFRYAAVCTSCRICDQVLYHVHIENENSLSRKIRTDLPEQFRILDSEILHIIRNCVKNDTCRELYACAFNYTKLRSVYSEAKRMHIKAVPRSIRYKAIADLCRDFYSRKLPLPRRKTAFLLLLPVKWKLYFVIDLIGLFLAKH